ncbi:MAG: hypothetical protein JXJ04_21895 [Spirochaetales bacterium]|nr:hypothetical protein [Spirochaetales bacterium]
MDNDFKPLLVNEDIFFNHYKGKGLAEIIHGLSWVTESFGIVDQLRKDPGNSKLKMRLIRDILPELKKEPVGEKAFSRLNEIEIYIEKHDSLETLAEMLDILLRELSKGYRLLLQGYATR